MCNRTGAANYIELPLLANYNISFNDANVLTLSAGPYVALGISGKTKTKGDGEKPGSEKLYYSQNTFDLQGTKRFDIGMQAGVAYSFNEQFSIGAESDFGFSKFGIGNRRNISGLVSITYRFVSN